MSPVAQPASGATGTLTWDLGTVVNTPSNNNTPFDALTIEYQAKVLPDTGIAHTPSTSLPNTATTQELFNACQAQGGAKWDHSAMVKALETMAGHEVAKA